jgi:hypothetical protein
MKVEYSQLNIFNPNSGHPPAELDGTGDPDGTPAFTLILNKNSILRKESRGEL